jgi:hypothetical protein
LESNPFVRKSIFFVLIGKAVKNFHQLHAHSAFADTFLPIHRMVPNEKYDKNMKNSPFTRNFSPEGTYVERSGRRYWYESVSTGHMYLL